MLNFFFPRQCPSCMEIIETDTLFCSPCFDMLSFIPTYERCPKCFTYKGENKCFYCIQHRELFIKKAALFEEGSPAIALLKDPEKYAKTMGALFILALDQFSWIRPDVIYSQSPLKKVSHSMGKMYALPKFSKYNNYAGKNVLCITNTFKDFNIPLSLYSSNIFLVAFSL